MSILGNAASRSKSDPGSHSTKPRLGISLASRFSWKTFRDDQLMGWDKGSVLEHAPLSAMCAQQHFHLFNSTVVMFIIRNEQKNCDQ